jgi:5'-methylthioadenosine phosphorylase
MNMVKVGIIGGSGLDDPKILQNPKVKCVDTPFGRPSSELTLGNLNGVDVVIIARHGKKHSIMPTNVPFQANVHALKQEGCTHIIATTACGSLREDIKPGDFVFIDQFIDRTTKRKSTFYEEGRVCHISMAEPFCGRLRNLLSETAKELRLKYHAKGTVVTIEGPRFSTKAESNVFRLWKADVINMSTVPEVVLAREAGICYAAVAMNTDYDCWRESEEPVTWEMVSSTMKNNADNVKKLISAVIPKIKFEECSCKEAIKTALV